MFSGLTIWHWLTNWCAVPRRRLFLLLSHSWVAVGSLDGLEAPWSFPWPLWHAHSCSPSVTFGSYVSKTAWVQLLTFQENKISQQSPRSSDSYSLSGPSSATFPEPSLCECFVDRFIRNGLHKSTFWWVVVFCSDLCCQEKFLWWGVKTTFICGSQNTCFGCRDYAGLVG